MFTAEELQAVAGFVRGGGGLVVLGETEEDKYGGNLNELLEPFGLRIVNGTVFDFGDARMPTWIPASASPVADYRNLLHQVRDVRLYRAGTLEAAIPGAVVLQTRRGRGPAPGRAAGGRAPTATAASWRSPTRTCSATTHLARS